jgi:hypothetical protein
MSIASSSVSSSREDFTLFLKHWPPRLSIFRAQSRFYLLNWVPKAAVVRSADSSGWSVGQSCQHCVSFGSFYVVSFPELLKDLQAKYKMFREFSALGLSDFWRVTVLHISPQYYGRYVAKLSGFNGELTG